MIWDGTRRWRLMWHSPSGLPGNWLCPADWNWMCLSIWFHCGELLAMTGLLPKLELPQGVGARYTRREEREHTAGGFQVSVVLVVSTWINLNPHKFSRQHISRTSFHQCHVHIDWYELPRRSNSIHGMWTWVDGTRWQGSSCLGASETLDFLRRTCPRNSQTVATLRGTSGRYCRLGRWRCSGCCWGSHFSFNFTLETNDTRRLAVIDIASCNLRVSYSITVGALQDIKGRCGCLKFGIGRNAIRVTLKSFVQWSSGTENGLWSCSIQLCVHSDHTASIKFNFQVVPLWFFRGLLSFFLGPPVSIESPTSERPRC